MIAKQDIADRAAAWRLTAEVVEKDYVLGWLLVAIAEHPVTSATWVFKGGTSIKKCVLETHRFSEDLDFSLLPSAPYDDLGLRRILGEIGALASERSGILFPTDQTTLHAHRNKQGRPTFEGRIGYRGPRAFPGWPRVLIDLTNDEPVVDPPVLRAISHPYPDAPDVEIRVRCYSLEELIAEKTRALLERSRPRDLYDVVYLLDNLASGVDLARTRAMFARKCAHKSLPPPTTAQLVSVVQASDELRAEWANMLAHQLPQLPAFDTVLSRLPEAIAWIDAGVMLAAAALQPLPLRPNEQVIATPSGLQGRGASALDILQFAGANRLVVDLEYNGRRRPIEPYSLRLPRTGNLLLYAWDIEADHIKAFNVALISGASATDTAFHPRYRIELAQ